MFKLYPYFFVSILLVTATTPGFSGSGFYFGADAISHTLKTRVEVNQVFSSPPPDAINVSNAASDDFLNASIRIGYKYKRRLNHPLYLSPELMVSQLDDGLVYGTNLKIGTDIYNFSFFGTGGISHIDQFDKNQFNYGVGLEYKISRKFSFNFEWQKFEKINEDTVSIENFGAQILTTMTETQRDISVIKFGLTFYFHE